MTTIEDYIKLNASLYPKKMAIVCKGSQCTYAELWQQISQEAENLRHSLGGNRIVTIRSSQSIEFLVMYFALHMCGYVVAPLERDSPDELFGQISSWLGRCDAPDGTADILYTTGTTGKPKGVMISHRTIIADAENLIDAQGFSHNLAFVVNGPLNHIGSLSKVYPVMMLGATLIIIEGMKDVNVFFEAMDLPYPKMATFLVPSSIRILLQFSAEKLSSYRDKIDFIETGAAAITQSDMEALCQMLPNTRLYNTYASTETGIISTYNFNDGKCMAGCLGRPMKHSRIIITESGLIACQGDTLMTGYVGDAEQTNRVLRNGTIYTQDMGRIDEEGMLHLTGREDDVINVGGFKVAPTEVENVAMELPEIADCICIATKHPVLGTALKLLVVLDNGCALDKKRIAQFIKSKIESYKVPSAYEQVEEVHRTYNGKIDRKFYRQK